MLRTPAPFIGALGVTKMSAPPIVVAMFVLATSAIAVTVGLNAPSHWPELALNLNPDRLILFGLIVYAVSLISIAGLFVSHIGARRVISGSWRNYLIAATEIVVLYVIYVSLMLSALYQSTDL